MYSLMYRQGTEYLYKTSETLDSLINSLDLEKIKKLLDLGCYSVHDGYGILLELVWID